MELTEQDQRIYEEMLEMGLGYPSQISLYLYLKDLQTTVDQLKDKVEWLEGRVRYHFEDSYPY